MSSTDYLRLNEQKIFKELCKSLPKHITKTLKLLTVEDSVLFTWDFQNSHVLCLNIKAVRVRQGDNVIHQKLLPLHPPLFSPEAIICNDVGSLLAVFGPSGILVLELPRRCPPYGAFDNNKEVIYCRSHSLDERLLACNDAVQIRQVKFHPGGANFNHVLALTSDNMLRLYQIKNKEAVNISVICVGEKPSAMFPGSKTPFLECFGETAIDFDFGNPEESEQKQLYYEDDTRLVLKPVNRHFEEKYMINVETQTVEKIVPQEVVAKEITKNNVTKLVWPIYILRGDLTVYSLSLDVSKDCRSKLKGPLSLTGFDNNQTDACSLICLNTVPQVMCIAMSNGTIYHSALLTVEQNDSVLKDALELFPSKEIIAFESVQLEMGLTTSEDDTDNQYKCPVFLHKEDSKPGQYYATHYAGVHSVSISCVQDLQNFVNGPDSVDPTADIFVAPSKVEYVVCTKTASSDKNNPVIGFAPYSEPSSLITLLGDGSLITLSVLYSPSLPDIENLTTVEDEETHSPLKKMLQEPFDVYIQKILKKASTQPVLKLSSTGEHSQEQCYEILQRTAQVFREEYFKHYIKAREELEKRVQILTIMRKNQQKEVDRMINERDALQEKASGLAEKHEDIKDKQDELLKRCENLLMLVNRKRSEPSDAEKAFMSELQKANETVLAYGNQIGKVKNKMKYQEVQMENWRSQEIKKVTTINDVHMNTIKNSLQDSTKKITEMIKEVHKFKKRLNLK